MSRIVNKITNFLSTKASSAAILAIAIAGRTIQVIFFFNIRVDRALQVMATQNLVHGHGVSISRVIPGDLSTTIFEPLINWPPGYSLLLAPFYLLFNQNYILAALSLDIIFAIILLVVCRSILKTLNVPLYLINIFTLFTSFFIYPFYFIVSSDAIAVTFFVIALYYTLLLLKTDSHRGKNTAIIAFCLIACIFIKYMFIPVAFVIPAFLIAKGMLNKQRSLIKTGSLTFVILAISLTGLLIYQKAVSGSAAYISEPGRGFFPGNLQHFYPFIPESIIKSDTIALLMGNDKISASATWHFFQWLNIAAILFILFYLSRDIYLHRLKKTSLTNNFLYIILFASLGLISLLSFLSLTVARETIFSGQLWTYVQEPRYYGLAAVGIHLSLFISYTFIAGSAVKWKRYIFWFMLVILLPEMLRGIVVSSKRVINFKKEEYSWQYENRFQQYADSIIKVEKQKLNASGVVITGPGYYMNYRVKLYSDVSLLNNPDAINNLSSINTKEPALILVILHEKDFPGFQPFLSAKEKEIAGHFDGFYFYTVYVKLH